MVALQAPALERYLRSLWGPNVRLLRVTPLAKPGAQMDAKGFGYGVPLRIDVDLEGHERSLVLETMSANSFGHEDPADRAQSLLWSHSAYNRLPRHATSIDVGAIREGGDPVALGAASEFFLLMNFVEGEAYAADLVRIRGTGDALEQDQMRSDALCDYLVEIHPVRRTEPGRYVRRIRELVGHGECIMGILDSYPLDRTLITEDLLKGIERLLVEWRWKLKPRTQRLCQVHGDFHPWNILFRKGTDFSVLDRSRGEWGDAADDVTSLSLNYAFFSLQRSGRVDGVLGGLFHRFWDRYLARTGDLELLEVAAPFLTFRSLVMANPIWYPTLSDNLRRKLLGFAVRVLEEPRFDPSRMNSYFEA